MDNGSSGEDWAPFFEQMATVVSLLARRFTRDDAGANATVDDALQDGASLRLTLTVGVGGPVGLVLAAVGVDGHATPIVVVDAPPTPHRFTLRRH